jgi:hypothetical protein
MEGAMSVWLLVLTPVAAAAVLALFRFTGCALIVSFDDYQTEPTYSSTVESDTPVAYWRLGEPHAAEPSPSPTVPNVPVSGGTAKDEIGQHDGTYKAVMLQQPPPTPLPPDSPAAPGALGLEAPGLLELNEQQKTSMSDDGGYVEVPFTGSLKLPSFTVEALVRPGWSSAERGLFRSVVTFCTVDVTPSKTKAFGFGLFAGPPPGAPGAPDVWQIWLGDGTAFKPFKDPSRDLTAVDFTHTNYLAVTYDDAAKELNMYVYVAGADLDSGAVHPVSGVTVPAYSPVSDPTQSLLIGMHRPPIGSGVSGPFPLYHPFKGQIQEVALYGKALNIIRVASHVSIGMHL